MTPALVVRIATHDIDLIAQTAGILGTIKQPESIVRRIGLCHAIAIAHIQLAMAMHMHSRPARMDVRWPVIICPGSVRP